MERLTKRTSVGAANLDYPEKCYCTDRVKGLIAMSAYRQKAFDRLAAYEDTGLEPEAIEQIKLSFMGKAIAEITEFEGIPVARLRELSQAEKDGRLVELPCKVGDKIYQTDGLDIYESEIRKIVFDTDNIAFDENAIGKSVFLTREEAEAELKRKVANNETD